MGLNVDLTHLIKAPKKVTCPQCGKKNNTYAHDSDTESPGINPEPGLWVLNMYCNHCEYEFSLVAELDPEWIIYE